MIYFIQEGNVGNIKIGYSKNPEARLKDLQVGNSSKLEIIHTEQGDKTNEKEYHKMFIDDKVGGEWFKPKNILKKSLKSFYTHEQNIYGLKTLLFCQDKLCGLEDIHTQILYSKFNIAEGMYRIFRKHEQLKDMIHSIAQYKSNFVIFWNNRIDEAAKSCILEVYEEYDYEILKFDNFIIDNSGTIEKLNPSDYSYYDELIWKINKYNEMKRKILKFEGKIKLIEEKEREFDKLINNNPFD